MHLLDANAFMEASRTYYTFAIAPGYWSWLIQKHQSGEIASVEAVLDEITAGSGPLVDWAKTIAPETFWVEDSAESLAVMRTLSTWAADPARTYNQAAVDDFMDSADLRLIAIAKATGSVLVTRETSDPACKRRVKIPDAALVVGVECVQPFVAYHRLGLSLTN